MGCRYWEWWGGSGVLYDRDWKKNKNTRGRGLFLIKMIADITAKLSQLWFPFSHKSAAWCPLVFVIFSANNSLTPLRHSYRSSSSCNSKTQGPESYKRYKLSTLHITSIYRSFLLSLLFHLFFAFFLPRFVQFFFQSNFNLPVDIRVYEYTGLIVRVNHFIRR